MFDWLNSVMTWVGKLIPRYEVMNTTECGVAFRRGRPIVVEPGRGYWWWPAWTEMVTRPFVRQTLKLPFQALTPFCSTEAWLVRAIVVYEVRDIEAAICKTEDIEEAIEDLCMASVKDAICSRSTQKFIEDRAKVDKAILRSLRSKMTTLGILVRNVYLTDCVPARVLRLVGDGNMGVVPDDDGSDD